MRTKEIPSELMTCIQFHGHLCPGLVIGYRAAQTGLEKLKHSRAKDEELICITMTDSCAVDAIQVITGCTLGKGNLIFQDIGKMVFIFVQRIKGRTVRGVVRLALNPKIMQRRLRAAVRGNKEAAAIALLNASPDRLFTIHKLSDYPLPERARIFPSHPCAQCGEMTMEPRLKIENGKMVCPECARNQYSRGW